VAGFRLSIKEQEIRDLQTELQELRSSLQPRALQMKVCMRACVRVQALVCSCRLPPLRVLPSMRVHSCMRGYGIGDVTRSGCERRIQASKSGGALPPHSIILKSVQPVTYKLTCHVSCHCRSADKGSVLGCTALTAAVRLAQIRRLEDELKQAHAELEAVC
jgi:hypothetical protein